jgi:predicted metal-dependent hydrolase
MRLTNTYLALTYAEFNKKWFSNRLPRDMVVRFANLDVNTHGLGITYMKFGRTLYIEVSRKLAVHSMLVDMTLLHEMVHVEHPEWNHGPKFQKRMLQLAKKGAFRHCW